MTDTGRWLDSQALTLRRTETLGGGLFLVGAVLATAGAGVLAARLGLYDTMPVTVFVFWAGVLAAGAYAAVRLRRRVRHITLGSLARDVESSGGLREGSVLVVAAPAPKGSSSLFASADRKTRRWLDENGAHAITGAQERHRSSVKEGGVMAAVGVVFLFLAGPATERGATFWSPATVLTASIGSVSIEVDRSEVRRGDTVVVTVRYRGRDEAYLETRAPGEPWRRTPLTDNGTGEANVTLGPLSADRYLRAGIGRRQTRELHLKVAIPAFLADLSLYARFPTYIGRADEPLLSGDSVLLPSGTRLLVNARATVPVQTAEWVAPSGDVTQLDVSDSRIQGETPVFQSGTWDLRVTPDGGGPLVEDTPVLHITAVRDSVPEVAVPVPGADTVIGASLRIPMVADVRDDYGVVSVLLETWSGERASAAVQVDTLSSREGMSDRIVASYVIDLNDRGFGSGDTAYYRVSAVDNSPARQRASSRTFALRLPSVAELREAIRNAARQLAQQADSLSRSQQELTDETEQLARQSERDPNDGLDFESAERANEVQEDQQALMDQAEQLREQLEELADASWEAEMTDPEWHEQLSQLQEMLEQAMTPEMQDAMENLQQAVEELDPEAVQQALEELAEQQQQMEEQLDRSRELLERAALEGAMSTLAEDTEDLARQQEEWNQQAEAGEMSDSALAAAEQQLLDQAESLEQQMQQVDEQMQQAGQNQSTENAQQSMQQAQQQMSNAQQQAQQGQNEQAQQSGENASQQLNPMSEELREQLEELREQWREEVLEQMDQAMTETADLAGRQEELSRRMERGESGGDLRGEQAAIREGVDQVIQRLQDAAGKNALVSPQLSTALGFSRLRMSEALEQIAQATPNTRQAAEMAAQAVDGLNAVASALMRNRGDVENSQSGSGMAEAMQQMAEMAAQQEALNGETGGMMPLMPQGGEELIQQLQQLADQQQALGEQLEEMAAEEGLPGATEEMAEEALALAEELARGQLDRETLERQEQLFKRMLDAGRSLQSDDEDEQKDRESETADPDNVQVPEELDPSIRGRGLRYPYPTWEQLRQFSPEQRRIILDYFRRLNGQGR